MAEALVTAKEGSYHPNRISQNSHNMSDQFAKIIMGS